MSSCLILQTHRDIFIGADTACSSFYNGKYYRVNNDFDKIYIVKDNIIFVSGELNAVKSTVKFLKENIDEHDKIKQFLLNIPPSEMENVYNVELMICKIINGQSVIYQFSEYNNFEIIEHKTEKDYIQILTAGYKSPISLDISTALLSRSKDIKYIFTETFNNISCNEIGGELIVYKLSDKTIVTKQLIKENNVEYIKDLYPQHTLVADAVMGRKIMGNEMELMANSSNGTSVSGFTFNGNGALFNNARATWNNSNGFQIVIDPTNQLFAMGSGIYTIGSNGVYTPRFNPPANISSATEWWNRTDLQNIQLFADSQGNLYLRGSVYAKNGYFEGVVYARDGEFTGKVTATSGIFKGTVQASDFLNPSGRSMLSANSGAGYKFDADFLDLKGISITDTYSRNSFSVNRSGYVTIGNGSNQITYNNSTGILSVKGSIEMGSGSSISWGDGGVAPPSAAQVGAIADKANAILYTHISQDAIRTNHIQAGAITTNKIDAGAITSTKIAADAITANMIKAGTMSADRISGGTITGITIGGATINGGDINVTSTLKVGSKIEMQGVNTSIVNQGNASIDFGSGSITLSGMSGIIVGGVMFQNGTIYTTSPRTEIRYNNDISAYTLRLRSDTNVSIAAGSHSSGGGTIYLTGGCQFGYGWLTFNGTGVTMNSTMRTAFRNALGIT